MLQPKLIELLEELLALGGNHDSTKTIKMRNKFFDYIRAEEFVLNRLDDENFILATDAIRLIDAHNIFASKTNQREASIHLKPFFDRINETQINTWNRYELRFLINSIHLTGAVEKAVELSEKAMKSLVKFYENKEQMECALACNMCAHLLYTKYFCTNIDLNLLANEFKIWLRRLEKVAENDNDSKLPLMLLVTKIREALFHQSAHEAHQLHGELEKYYDEAIAKSINNEIHSYTTAKEYTSFGLKDQGVMFNV